MARFGTMRGVGDSWLILVAMLLATLNDSSQACIHWDKHRRIFCGLGVKRTSSDMPCCRENELLTCRLGWELCIAFAFLDTRWMRALFIGKPGLCHRGRRRNQFGICFNWRGIEWIDGKMLDKDFKMRENPKIWGVVKGVFAGVPQDPRNGQVWLFVKGLYIANFLDVCYAWDAKLSQTQVARCLLITRVPGNPGRFRRYPPQWHYWMPSTRVEE